MLITPEISACSIVMLGEFNPAIFHPAWLKANSIEHNIDDEVVSIDIVHRDVSIFRIDTRFYNVQLDRFSLETTTAPWVQVLDITRLIFEEFLLHTPIRAFGVNRYVHLPMKNPEARTKLMRRLAPLEPWGELGQQISASDAGLPNGLASLTMTRTKEGMRNTLISTNIKIEPSVRIKGNHGLFVEVNHHHHLPQVEPGSGSMSAIALLCDVFDEELREAEQIVDTIVDTANE